MSSPVTYCNNISADGTIISTQLLRNLRGLRLKIGWYTCYTNRWAIDGQKLPSFYLAGNCKNLCG